MYKSKNGNDWTYADPDDITLEKAEAMVQMMYRKFGADFPYKLRSLEGRLVWLDKTDESECIICKKKHDENLTGVWISMKNKVYFDCGHAPKRKKIFLGVLPSKTLEK